MDSIVEFIEQGWHTVPYESIKRVEGRKIASPAIQWKSLVNNKNTRVTPAGAVITGPQSNVIVLDCDNSETVRMFSKLGVSEARFAVETSKGMHYYFSFDERLSSTFRVHKDALQFDLQSSDSLVYLPTDAAEGYKISRLSWPLLPMPEELVNYLVVFKELNETRKMLSQRSNRLDSKVSWGTPLRRLWDMIDVKREEFWHRVTPTASRVNGKGILPEEVEAGGGNDYMIGLAGILASDTSIDEEVYEEILYEANSCWEYPYEEERLRPIIDNYKSGKYLPFEFDSNWMNEYSSFEKDGDDYLAWFDPIRNEYILYNDTEDNITYKDGNASAFAGVLSSYKNENITKKTLVEAVLPSRRVIYDITNTDKFFSNGKKEYFNAAETTEYIEIIRHGTDEKVMEPTTILKLMKNLWPEPDHYDYILRFLKRKLTTFDYSPVVIVLFDKGGTGKSLFFSEVVRRLLGETQTPSVSESTFLEKYNEWIESSVFSYHDEFSKANRYTVTKLVKELSGSDRVGIRAMQRDVRQITHHNTMYFATNELAFEIKDNEDRRFFISSPKDKLVKTSWFNEELSMQQMHLEIKGFCQYLHKEVEPLTNREYQKAPSGDMKKIFEEDSQTLVDALIGWIKASDWSSVIETFGSAVIEEDRLNLTLLREDEKLSGMSANLFTRLLKQGGINVKKTNNTPRITYVPCKLKQVKFSEPRI